MAEGKPLSIRLAQATALFVSSTAAGVSLSISAFVIPPLLESPTPLMLRQWKGAFQRGRRTMPAAGEAAALAYFYLAYRFGLRHGLAGRLYLLAGGLCVGIVPYTLAVIMPTNRKLLKKVEDARELGVAEELLEVGAREEGAKYLVDHWGMLNLGRAAMVAAASVIGLFATL